MKTRILLIFLLIIVPAIKMKAQSSPSLVVWQKNGEKVIYKPNIYQRHLSRTINWSSKQTELQFTI